MPWDMVDSHGPTDNVYKNVLNLLFKASDGAHLSAIENVSVFLHLLRNFVAVG